MAKRFEIRNSTAEFLIFQMQDKADGVEVMYADETIWCTQDAIAALFDKGRSTIAEHLSNIFNEGELQKDSVCRKFRRTATARRRCIKHWNKKGAWRTNGLWKPGLERCVKEEARSVPQK